MTTEPLAPIPRSHRVLDAVVGVLATWTVLCHAVVVTGTTTRTLVTTALLVLMGWIAWRCRRRRTHGVATPMVPAAATRSYSEARGWPWWRWLAVVIPLLLAWGLWTNPQARFASWVVAVLYLIVALVLELRDSRRRPIVALPRAAHGGQRVVWVLAALAVLATLSVYRYNMDDVFYLSMAVDVADRPDIPLLSLETLHGIPDLPMRHTGYRFHVLEPLAGCLAFITGIDVIYWVHWGFAGFAAALLVFAYARLLRLLAPGRWLWCLGAVLAILCTFADGFGWNGAMAFVRLQQSKAIFLSVFVPLLIAYAIEFAQRPSRPTWKRLLLAQVAAAGITTTALWMTPVVAGLGLLAAVRLDRKAAGTLASGIAASTYPVVLALALLFMTMRAHAPPSVATMDPALGGFALTAGPEPGLGGFVLASHQGDDPNEDRRNNQAGGDPGGDRDVEDPDEGSSGGANAGVPDAGPNLVPSEDAPGGPERAVDLPEEEGADLEPGDFSALDPIGTMASAKRYILGHRHFGWILGLAAALAWCLSAESLARRFALVFPLGFLLVLYNPFTASFISEHVTRDYTYWRVFWVLPGPILMALCVTAPVVSRHARWRSVATMGLIAALLYWGPTRYQWHRIRDYVSVWPIRLKVTNEYEVARVLSRHTPQNAQVLASWGVSAWLTAVHGHPYPLSARRYLTRFQAELGMSEINRRHRMTSMMTGKRRRPNRRLIMRAISDYKIGAVCFPKRLQWDEDPVPGFYHRGFKLVYEDDLFYIWVRPPEFGSATPWRPRYLRPKDPVPIAPRRLPHA